MIQDSSQLVFICGFPSSGTDLLKNLLNAHPEVYIGGEFPLLPSLAARRRSIVPAANVQDAVSDIVGCDSYGNLARRTLPHRWDCDVSFARLYAELLVTRPVRVTGNKTPQNSENIAALNALFPAARYILIVRDIRDVALSWMNKWGKNPRLCAHKWNARMRLACEDLERLAAGRHLVVTYEALLDDHAGIARRICDFLGLDFDERMIDYHLSVEERTPGKLNYGAPVISANKGKWRDAMAPNVVARIEEIAFDSMKHFGYEPAHARAARPLSVTERVRGAAQDMFALQLVGNTAANANRKGYLRRAVAHEFSKRFGRYRLRRP